ncbi:hypothetical protein O181_048730 [Austropuccinia psidii MF-1]|uniref:Reverse transcriptase/retrotransposon-derived protein RNase H-like domain-containing protein n=1 Tax=Austropuccinia psidii MF-1 TaxID=1389203 RepID=A0A9Q3DXS4_9BASI|nr:hypothetical protein [Austropuccinia psidii MF-1]
MPHNRKEIMPFLAFSSYYKQKLKEFIIHARSLYRVCDQKTVFKMRKERIQEYGKIKYSLTNAPLLVIPEWRLPLNLYIDACGEDLGEALHQVHIVNYKAYDCSVFYLKTN